MSAPPPGAAAPHALVVGADPAARAGVAELLAVAGWQVLETGNGREAVRLARSRDLDLVVTDLPPSGEGIALLHRLRMAGCRALLLVVADADAQEREAAQRAGALACLRPPVDARLLLRFLRDRRRPTGAPDPAARAAAPLADDLDPGLMDRIRGRYADALPERLEAIAEGARAGDAPALAAASTTLAGTSAQLGHPEVAAVCRAIARDARRGVLAHDLVRRLQAVAGS